MSKSTVKKLTEGNPTSLIIGFALPLLSGMLFQQLYNLVDTIIVGKTLGKEALGAVGSTGCINFMVLGFVIGVCSGFAIPVAQRFGAESYKSMRQFVSSSIILSVIISIVLTVGVGINCRAILEALNTPENIIDMSYSYIFIIFMGIPVVFLYNLTAGVMRSLGDSKTPVYFLVLASIINIVLDITFIKVVGMGVDGPAYATVISQLVAGVACLIYMIKKFPILKMEKGDFGYHPHHIKVLLGMGFPMGIQYSITAIGSVILQTSVNSLGSDAVASVTAAGRLSQFLMCPFDALGSTMATYCGQNVGARKPDRVWAGVKSATLIALVYSAFSFVFIYLLSGKLLLLFLDPSETVVIGNARTFIIINVSFYFFLACVNIYRFAIQGMGHSMVAIIAGVMEMIARSVVALTLVAPLGVRGAAFANPFAWILADLFLVPTFFYYVKKLKNQS